MTEGLDYKPMLRPIEVFALSDGDHTGVGVRDRSGLSDVVLVVSEPTVQLLALMDGGHTCADIRQQFLASFGQALSSETLQTMLKHLDEARLLDGPSFDTFYQTRQDAFRSAGVRDMPHAEAMGITDTSGTMFDEILAEIEPSNLSGGIRGLIVPHLDYPRGRSCYGAAYAVLDRKRPPHRVVILGTNHFGRSESVVATGSDFVTPLGRTRVDVGFLERLEACCGDLRAHELDHLYEHSIELQVLWLQHLYGADTFQMVPVLCPDPCGPTGTAPSDGEGPDLCHFADVLAEATRADAENTLLIAGADLSHMGAAFGDPRALDDKLLDEVRSHDLFVLERLRTGGANAFLDTLRETENRTNICSVGCVFVASVVLADASITRLDYHQAVDQDTQTCVTCAALAFT